MSKWLSRQDNKSWWGEPRLWQSVKEWAVNRNSNQTCEWWKAQDIRVPPETELGSASKLAENPKYNVNRRNAFRKSEYVCNTKAIILGIRGYLCQVSLTRLCLERNHIQGMAHAGSRVTTCHTWEVLTALVASPVSRIINRNKIKIGLCRGASLTFIITHFRCFGPSIHYSKEIMRLN